MLERGLLSRILYPVPPPSYHADSFPKELIWIPKKWQLSSDGPPPPLDAESVPCLLLTYPSARFLIIFFHSNAEDLGRCRGFCCYLREQFQVHVLAVEYPGYGVCPGTASGQTVMENAQAALHFATDVLKWPLDSIKVFGRSIGTGPAVQLASLFTFAGVILVTPFLSIQELFRDRVGPLANLVEEWFANGEEAPKIKSPTMIIHGQRDELISCRHGEQLYEALRSRKLLVSPPDMEHNTNLLTNLQYFVLPMFQFFALPDYVFQDMEVPEWVYDRRRCPAVQHPTSATSLSPSLPHSLSPEFAHQREAATALQSSSPGSSPESQQALSRIQAAAGRLIGAEICSDKLCEAHSPLPVPPREQPPAAILQTSQRSPSAPRLCGPREGLSPQSAQTVRPSAKRSASGGRIAKTSGAGVCAPAAWTAWCSSRGNGFVDMHEAADPVLTVIEGSPAVRSPPTWVPRTGFLRKSRPAPATRPTQGGTSGSYLPPGCRTVPTPIMGAWCCNGPLEDDHGEPVTPENFSHSGSAMDEELLPRMGVAAPAAIHMPRGVRCAISI